jgi:hypothetical protein
MQSNKHDAVVVRKTRMGGYALPFGRPTADNICEALPQLNAWGFRNIYDRHSDKEHEELRAELLRYTTGGSTPGKAVVRPDALKKLILWLSGFERSKRWSRSSYGLKHIFERETDVYVTDGLFTLGALMEGFTARFWNDSQSAVFQMRRPVMR